MGIGLVCGLTMLQDDARAILHIQDVCVAGLSVQDSWGRQLVHWLAQANEGAAPSEPA